MKLSLGTVAFGLDYGITNKTGQVAAGEVASILSAAQDLGISLLDTAALYGNSETALGNSGLQHQFKIVTKLPEVESPTQLEDNLSNSLYRLGCKQIYGLLFHRPDILLTPAGEPLVDCLNQLKRQGKLQKWGVSVYTPEEAISLFEHFAYDLIQVPLNLLDQRFIRTGTIDKLHAAGVEIHARSLLLQGLLCQQPWPSKFDYWQNEQRNINGMCRQMGISPLELAISFIHDCKKVDQFVLGCQNVEQLTQLVDVYNNTMNLQADYSTLSCVDEQLIVPSNW